MTRVLFVQGGAERAGAERVLLSLMRCLDRAEFTPVVAFCGQGPFLDEILADGIEVVRLPAPPRLRELHRVPGMIRALAGAIRSTRADIVHGNGEKMSVLAGWAARRAGVPCAFWLHDAPGHRPNAWAVQAALALTPRTAVVACSRWMAEEFTRRFRVSAVGIHNGVELDALPVADGAIARLKAEAGWPTDAVVAIHATRLQRWKGTEVFLRAAARLRERVPNLRFLIVGGALYGREVDWASALPGYARSLGLNGEVRFTGYRADALELMAGSDIVAHCSLDPEPFPMVVLEAMALGRSLVATRTRGPEEAIEHDRTGLLLTPGDDVELAEALACLATDPVRRARIGATAAAVAHHRFSAERMAGEFEALYRRLLS
jgi:glycosyltransferase involved in cell wall biosynthesis